MSHMPGNHTPYWPSMRDTAIVPPERVLAGMARDGSLFTEDGRVWPRIASWDDLKAFLVTERCILYTGSPLATWLAEWWGDITVELEPEAAKGERLQWIKAQGRTSYTVLNWSETAGAVVSLTLHVLAPGRNGRRCWQTRSIVQSSTWGEKEPSLSFLQTLRSCFQLLLSSSRQGMPSASSATTATTPGAAGAQTMYALWREAEREGRPFVRHHRPTSECLHDLTEHAVGSYKDAWRPDEVFQTVYELDRTNGFASECRLLPAGTVRGPLKGSHARLLLPGNADRLQIAPVTWFGHCAVRIAAPGLPPGDVAPFLVRSLAPRDGQPVLLANEQQGRNKPDGELYAPTQPGVYDVWLWKEEAEAIAAREAEGSPIRLESIDYAWYWERSTTQLAEWAARLDEQRRRAMAESPAVGKLVKTCIVAAIGRLGMAATRCHVTTDGGGSDSATLLDAGGPDALPLFLHTRAGDSGAPKHWHAYILMKQNLWLLRLAHHLWKAGYGDAIIGLNVDAVTLDCLPPAGFGVDPAAARLGDTKLRAVGDGIFYAMPAAAIQISPDKLKTPGLPPDRRRLVMAGEFPLHGLTSSPKQEEGKQTRRAMKAARRAVTAETEWEETFRRCMRLRDWYMRQRGPLSEREQLDAWRPLYVLEKVMRGRTE